MTDKKPTWERWPYETQKAFQAFVTYRVQGTDRSLAAVAQELGKSTTLMSRWSSRWDWVARCDEYDAHLERIERARREAEIIATRERHVQIARLLLAKATMRLQDLEPHEITPATLDRLVKVGAELELTSLGAVTSTSRTEITGPDGAPFEPNASVRVVWHDVDGGSPSEVGGSAS